MKVLKYVLLTIGFLGLIATIYNMINVGAISNHMGTFVCSLGLLFMSFNLDKLSNGFKHFNE